MPSLNHVMLMGNLCRDAELRVTPKGTPVAQFSIAINRDWKNEAGEKQTEVLFIDCEAWSKSAETIAKYVGRGQSLYVEGRLRQDLWEDKNTHEKKSRIKVVVEQFQFIGTKDDRADSPPASQPPPQKSEPAADRSAAPAKAGAGTDEDVPW